MIASSPRLLSEADDRTRFDCGRSALNLWFQRHAWPNQKSGVLRVYIMTDHTNRIIGFAALSASQIERGFLPKQQQRDSPDPLPVILLGQLAVDKDFKGQGHARSLLFFALKTALHAAENIGGIGVITHPLDESLRRFYARWGFDDLPFDPRRAMMVRIVDLKKSFVLENP